MTLLFIYFSVSVWKYDGGASVNSADVVAAPIVSTTFRLVLCHHSVMLKIIINSKFIIDWYVISEVILSYRRDINYLINGSICPFRNTKDKDNALRLILIILMWVYIWKLSSVFKVRMYLLNGATGRLAQCYLKCFSYICRICHFLRYDLRMDSVGGFAIKLHLLLLIFMAPIWLKFLSTELNIMSAAIICQSIMQFIFQSCIKSFFYVYLSVIYLLSELQLNSTYAF